MGETVLHIKNMVCPRCVMAVRHLLESMAYPVGAVELGSAVIRKSVSAEELAEISSKLQELGFELIQDKRTQITEQIKNSIIELICYQGDEIKLNLSHYLSDRLSYDYSYLSRLFSEKTGITIERYYILQKIEKAKELLLYDELTLNEIALQLHYSSAAHLSAQFKSITGYTPSQFKHLKQQPRKFLDKIL